MKRVSVIIPVYNSRDTIKKCLNSVINQTYKNIEVIIINDGSTDDSLKIINDICYNKENIKIINQENKGVSAARNNGIKASTGEYISFVDSDDWVEENFIELMVKSLEEECVDVVRCNLVREFQNKKEYDSIYELSNTKFEKNIYKSTINNHFLLYGKEPIFNYVMLFLIKRECLKEDVFFNEDLYMMEDVLFYQKIFNSIDSIYFLDKPLYHYNNYSISATRDIKKIQKNILGILETGEKIKEYVACNRSEVSIVLLNTNLIDLIITYLLKAYSFTYNELKRMLQNLYNNNKFNLIIKEIHISKFSIYRQMLIKLLRRKNVKLVIGLLKLKNIIKKK